MVYHILKLKVTTAKIVLDYNKKVETKTKTKTKTLDTSTTSTSYSY